MSIEIDVDKVRFTRESFSAYPSGRVFMMSNGYDEEFGKAIIAEKYKDGNPVKYYCILLSGLRGYMIASSKKRENLLDKIIKEGFEPYYPLD